VARRKRVYQEDGREERGGEGRRKEERGREERQSVSAVGGGEEWDSGRGGGKRERERDREGWRGRERSSAPPLSEEEAQTISLHQRRAEAAANSEPPASGLRVTSANLRLRRVCLKSRSHKVSREAVRGHKQLFPSSHPQLNDYISVINILSPVSFHLSPHIMRFGTLPRARMGRVELGSINPNNLWGYLGGLISMGEEFQSNLCAQY